MLDPARARIHLMEAMEVTCKFWRAVHLVKLQQILVEQSQLRLGRPEEVQVAHCSLSVGGAQAQAVEEFAS